MDMAQAFRVCIPEHGLFYRQNRLLFPTFLYIFISIFIQATSANPFVNFYFTAEPNNVVVSKGKPLLINCSAFHPSFSPSIQWIKNGHPISFNRETRYYKLQNGSLYFNEIRHSRTPSSKSDKGSYQCSATAPRLGVILSRPAIVEISHMAKIFEEEPKVFNPRLYLGDAAILLCSIKGQPKPSITWYRDGSRILPSSNVHTYSDGVLEISKLEFSDFATYHCEARSSDRVRRSRTILIQQNPNTEVIYEHVKPKFVITPSNVQPNHGTNTVLHCAANGRDRNSRQPRISWLKDGVTINFAKEPRFSIIGSGTLQVITVRASDSGTYTCRAENAEDSVDADAKLTVLVPPSITKKPKNTVAVSRTDVLLECDVDGVPAPQIKWMKDGAYVQLNSYIMLVDNRSLRILGAITEDSGMYQCFGTNRLSTVHADAQLIVVKPDLPYPNDPSSRVLVHHSRNRNKLPAEPLDPTAVYTSTRYVTFTWKPPKKKDNEKITGYRIFWKENNSERERVMNTTKTEASIRHLRHNTKYTINIQAINKYGPSLSMASLLLKTKKEVVVPGAPRELVATTLSPMSILIKWRAPQPTDSKVIKYELYYYKTSDTSEHRVNTRKSTSHILSGLQPFTKYSFRVVAHNKNGRGQNSEEVSAKTYSAPPTGPPVNVSVEVSSTTSLIVSWAPPDVAVRNGDITGYKIRYKQRGQRGTTVTTDSKRRNYALVQLEKETEYMVRVAAINNNGSGPVTSWLSAKTLPDDKDETRVPGQPATILLEAVENAIIISWKPPVDSIMIRGYIVSYGIGHPDRYEVDLDADKNDYTIHNIRPKSQYVVAVKAYNKRGAGRAKLESIVINEKPAAERLTPMFPPVGLVTQVLSSTTIMLRWTDSSLSQSQKLTDNRYYTVRYGPERKKRFMYQNSTDLNTHIENLQPYTSYTFAVKVIKGNRESEYSMTTKNTTSEAAPDSPPQKVTVISIDPMSVMVNWQPPDRMNGRITGYLVYYTMESSEASKTNDMADWALDGVMGSELSKNVNDLRPDSVYHFKVQAHNKKGYGPMSKTIIFRTAKDDGTGGGEVAKPGSKDAARNTYLISPDAPYGWLSKDKQKQQKKIQRKLKKYTVPTLPTTIANKGAAVKEEKKEGGLPMHVLIIIIASVVGVTFIVVTVIVVCVVCKRRADNEERKKRKPNIIYKTPSKAIPKDQNPPDLWIVGEKCQGGGEAPASISASSRNSQDMKSMDEMPPGMELLERRRNSLISDQGFDPPKLEDRYVRPTAVRPKPMLLPVENSIHREPIATVTAIPNGHLMHNLSAENCVPMRPVYPRTQYNTQYTTPPRVHAGDVSQPSSVGYHDDDDASAAEDTFIVGRNVGYVKPQLPTSPFKKPNPPIPSAPLKSRSPKPALIGRDSKNTTTKSQEDMQKSMSTEELHAEMANLDVLMKDLNDITHQDFQC